MNERDKELAEQCVGIRPYDNSFDWEKFAKLIRADEREACAKLCEELVLEHPGRADKTADQCAAAIRAKRGELK